MINEKEFGRLIAQTEANAKAIEYTNDNVLKLGGHITWIYRGVIALLLGFVFTVVNIQITDAITKKVDKEIEKNKKSKIELPVSMMESANINSKITIKLKGDDCI